MFDILGQQLKADEEAKLKADEEAKLKANKPETIQIKAKSSPKLIIKANQGQKKSTVKKLKGLQLELAKYFYKKIEKENLSGENKDSTGPMGPRQIAEEMQWTVDTVKLNIKRLREKEFLRTVYSQKGSGGWSKYGLSPELIQHIKNTFIESF